MMNYNKLTPQEERVIINKATEPPFKGEYDNFYQDGTFICRRCNGPLFSSKSKFDAGCGWPSFELKYYTSHVLAKNTCHGCNTLYYHRFYFSDNIVGFIV